MIIIIFFLIVIVVVWVIWSDHEQQNEEYKHKRERLISFINVPCFVIDSNIWMNENYDALFSAIRSVLQQHSQQLVLYGVQFDEICNVKKKTGKDGGIGNERNRRARLAINRVEQFQKMGLLRIEPVTIDAKIGAYADPMIVKLLVNAAKKNKETCFISDDKELRIRVRE
ncbi:MAG: hypothetical protein LBP87_00300, partial [Planctomycetaceae bacterium]|nr:hypothetical protein [Planctomycetaceae bacterium]